MLISSLKYLLRNVWPNIWSPWPSQVDIINYTNLYLWMRKKANPWRHHDLVTELAEPNLKFNPVSKQVSSFTLHLLNKKQTLFFFFSFFSQPFPWTQKPDFQSLFKLKDNPEGAIYHYDKTSRISKNIQSTHTVSPGPVRESVSAADRHLLT